jgi:DHA1 family bicyclomycin/chloramphenicol resistance-like MFS transporter
MQIEFSRYCLSGGFIFSIVAIMYVSFPFLFTRLVGGNPFALSIALAFGVFSCIVGSVVSTILIRWMSPQELYRLGFLFLLTGLFLGIMFYKFAPATLITFMLPVTTILVGAGIIFPNAMADALAVQEIPIGISSAMFSGFQMLLAGIGSAVMSRFNMEGPLPLILVLASVSLIAILSYTLPFWRKVCITY